MIANDSLRRLYPILACLGLLACTPTVQMQAPDKPIEINMNVNIQHEVRVKVDKELDSAIENNPDLFGVE